MPDCTAVPQPIIPCEQPGDDYILGACPHVGHVLNGSLKKTFAGATNYVSVPNNSGISTTGPISISMWIRSTNAHSTRTAIFGHYTHTPGTPTYAGLMVFYHSNKIGLGGRRDSGNYFAIVTDSTVTLGEWIHIVAVYNGDGSTNHIYVDGVDVGVGPAWGGAPETLSGGITNPDIVGIIGGGKAFSNTPQYFQGDISNVAYYVKALSAAEALAEYEAGCPADIDDGDLNGYWPLDGNFTDISTGGSTIGDGTAVGSVPDEIDVTRPVAQIKQEDLDITDISATTALYYTIWQDPVLRDGYYQKYNYGARLDEITLHYTAAGGGGGGGVANIITASDVLASNLAFSTVSGNAVIIDSRDKLGVRILGMNSAYDCALRKDTSGGDIISYVPAGNTRLRASIPVADGTDVYLDGDSNTTLTFSWSPKAT